MIATPGQIVVYECPMGHITSLRVADRGRLPAMFQCRGDPHCSHTAYLSPSAERGSPTFEFFQPTMDEVSDIPERYRDYLAAEGLLIRPI